MNVVGIVALSIVVIGGAAAGGMILLSSGPLADTPQNGQADAEWAVQTIAGSGPLDYVAGFRDGPSDSAEFAEMSGVAVSSNGTVYIAEAGNRRIRALDADYTNVRTYAGSGDDGIADGAPDVASFALPGALLVGPRGDLYVSDSGGHRIRKVLASQEVTTIAGGGEVGLAGGGFEDGPTEVAKFDLPAGLALDSEGNLLVADKNNHAIRVVTPDGEVSTLVGGPTLPGHVDGPLEEAQFSGPVDVAVGTDGSIYVLEHGNNALRVIDSDMIVRTLIGGGPPCRSEEECAESPESLTFPSGLVVGEDGFIYIADRTRIVRISPDGTDFAVVAGTRDSRLADGSPGGFVDAVDLAFAGDGSLVVVDAGASRVRLVRRD